MAEREGMIRLFSPANQQGEIEPLDADKTPVLFYLKVVDKKEPVPQPGDRVFFEAPPTQLSKKKQPIKSQATRVSIIERSSLGKLNTNQPANILRNKPPEYDKFGYHLPKANLPLALHPPETANLGLLLDKYVGYDNDPKRNPEKAPGKSWLSRVFVPHSTGALSTNEYINLFETYRQRWLALLEAAQAQRVDMQTTWRLVVHLGRASVIENGTLALHPVYGFPYIPGQSLKGLAHAYAELVAYRDNPSLIYCLFGKVLSKELLKLGSPSERSKWETPRQGSVVFFEALPVTLASLEVDILNVHFPDWYGQKGSKPPTDDQNPRPVNFLTIPPKTRFMFAVGPSKTATENESDIKLAQQLLVEALKQLGVGAKTAAGYGQFTDVF